MKTLAKSWWKIAVVAVVMSVLDVAGHLMEGTPLPDLPRSVLAATLGAKATVSIYFVLMFGVLGCVFVLVQAGLGGSKVGKGLRFGAAIGLLFFLAVVEMHPVFGTPIWGDIRTGIADLVPVVLMGLILGLSVGTSSAKDAAGQRSRPVLSIAVIALLYLAGRYFAYAVIGIESGHLSRPLATLLWTAATGICVGLAHWLLGAGAPGRSAAGRALWFTGWVFGTSWVLFHLFMPFVFDVPVAAVLLRPVLDMTFVFAGSWIAEARAEPRSLGAPVTT